jgi:hypothetical protein
MNILIHFYYVLAPIGPATHIYRISNYPHFVTLS